MVYYITYKKMLLKDGFLKMLEAQEGSFILGRFLGFYRRFFGVAYYTSFAVPVFYRSKIIFSPFSV